MAYNLKITVYNNRDYEKVFALNDENGPRDLTGCSLIFSIGGQGVLIRHESDDVDNECIFIENAEEGLIKLVLPFSVLDDLSGPYNHDCILIDADGKRSGIWSGKMTVLKGVSL